MIHKVNPAHVDLHPHDKQLIGIVLDCSYVDNYIHTPCIHCISQIVPNIKHFASDS